MSKHKEFMTKLSELMAEYNAEISVTYYESSCECCSGDYEVSFETVIDKKHEKTEVPSSYVYSSTIKDYM